MQPNRTQRRQFAKKVRNHKVRFLKVVTIKDEEGEVLPYTKDGKAMTHVNLKEILLYTTSIFSPVPGNEGCTLSLDEQDHFREARRTLRDKNPNNIFEYNKETYIIFDKGEWEVIDKVVKWMLKLLPAPWPDWSPVVRKLMDKNISEKDPRPPAKKEEQAEQTPQTANTTPVNP